MKHYICQLIFEITVDKEHKSFDEMNVYFSAVSKGELNQKIELKSKEMETEFISHYNKLVTWKYLGLIQVFEFDDLNNGMELFSREFGEIQKIEKEKMMLKFDNSILLEA